MAELHALYRARLDERLRTRAIRDRQHAWVSWSRFALVVAAVALVVWLGAAAATPLSILLVLFLVSLVFHLPLLNRRDRARFAVGFYERGVTRLDGTWPGRGDMGERFREPDHPYADDLDVFGRGSLFELLGTSRTQVGQATLARWLSGPASPEVVRARQDAVRELATRLDLREEIAVQDDAKGERKNGPSLAEWSISPKPISRPLVRIVMAIVTIPIVVSLVATTMAMFSGNALPPWLAGLRWAALGVQGIIALAVYRQVSVVIRDIDAPARELALLEGVLRTIEGQTFTSAHLLGIQRALGGRTTTASSEIARLGRLVAMLQSRTNLVVLIPAGLTAWATQMGLAIDAWRLRVGQHVPAWLDAVGEFEALLCLSAYAAEQPGLVFPDMVSAPACVEARAVAHPLLPETAVANDVTIREDGVCLLVVSGSNMSGKSTFMRAIGLNVVLAQAGAPVRATSFRVSPLTVGASIRIVDSLQDGRSRFMAEILRLKQIVALAQTHRGRALFLLDEILAGTNSHDRRLGAAAVVAGLVETGAIGLVTTHDLALGEIAARMEARAANVHFADEFDAGGLAFDYRLRPGVVRTSNALALMRSIGLAVPDSTP